MSRYAGVPFYYNKVDNKYIYGTCKNLKSDIPYKLHKVVEGDTLDSIALYYYNNPTYYWIVADFNKIQDPYINLDVGSKLKIPTLVNVEFEE